MLQNKGEDYGRKQYLKDKNIEDTREWFKPPFGLQPFAGNFSRDRRYANSNWLCQYKSVREEESHITSENCEVYGDLTNQFGDLSKDQNLVDFFWAVLDQREDLEEEDRKQQSSTADVIAKPASGDTDRTSRLWDLSPIEPQ